MSILFFIAILAFLILSHELGHFVFAKIRGVKVEEFGFGFPPRLFGFKKGETTYSVNLLPLGGFVKIFGEDGPAATSDAGRAFYSQPAYSRALILFAGVLFNFLLAWIIFSIIFAVDPSIKFPWYEAIWQGLKTIIVLTGAIFAVLFELLKFVFTGKAIFALKQLTGPVGIVSLVGKASHLGWAYVFQLTAFLSLNLAIVNFLPFPALDGGRMLFLGIEVLKGSPLNRKWSGFAHTLGFVILIILMAIITYRDIIKL